MKGAIWDIPWGIGYRSEKFGLVSLDDSYVPEIWKEMLGALSLKEEISHAKLSIKVIYPEHPDVL